VVKIIDFGLARACQTRRAGVDATIKVEPGTVWGTVDYIAPEQAQNIHAADIRSDLYSLGCTFYHALSGQVPFAGRNDLEKLLKHQLQEAAPISNLRPEIPAVLAAIIKRLMAKERTRRFQTPADLTHELAGVCDTKVSGIRTPDLYVHDFVRQPAAGVGESSGQQPLPDPMQKGDGHSQLEGTVPCLQAASQSTLDEMLRSAGPAPPIDDAFLESWRRWAAIVELFAQRRDGRRRVSCQSYDLLRKQLLQECEAQASIADGVRREFFLNLAEMVKPWLNPDTLLRTETELLYSLLGHCRQVEQGLLAMAASQDMSEDGQTLLGRILDLFKRRPEGQQSSP
jgi:hypothetical protein